MLFWLKTIFCSTQMLDVNLLSEIENTSDILKAFGKKELCENEETQQKNQELTKTGDKNFYENQSNSNLLDDLKNFIDESFNNRYNNVDYNLSDKMLSMTSECNFMLQSRISNQYISKKSDKQFCTIRQSGNDPTKHSHKNAFFKNNTNVLLHSTKNDLLHEQYINQENNTSLQKFNNVTVLSDRQSCHGETNCINKPDNSQINKLSNVIDSSIKKPKNSKYSSSAYKNKKTVKVKKKKPKTDNIKNEKKSGNKSKRRKEAFAKIFTAKEHEFYEKYKSSEKAFRKFCKSNINKKILQYIKNIEIFNLSDDLKQNYISALRNLSSFLDTVSAIRFDTRKKYNRKEFLHLLDLAYNQLDKYADVSQKLLIFKSICKTLHEVNDSIYCCTSCCDFIEVNKLIFSVDIRFNSFYGRLSILRDDFKKNDQH